MTARTKARTVASPSSLSLSLSTEISQVSSRVSPCETCGGKIDIGVGFSTYHVRLPLLGSFQKRTTRINLI